MRKLSRESHRSRPSLNRFIQAQNEVDWSDKNSTSFDIALKELEQGEKTSHWIWYVFPQLDGLGMSRMNELYSLNGVEEAEEYLKHDILKDRLRQAFEKVNLHAGKQDQSMQKLFGSRLDTLKFTSSVTLFAHVSKKVENAQAIHDYSNLFIDILNKEGFSRCNFTESRCEIYYGPKPSNGL